MPVPSNPFQNPFYNRFNDPVTRRPDEMEAYAWLRTPGEIVLRNNADSSNLCHPQTKEHTDEGHRLFGEAV